MKRPAKRRGQSARSARSAPPLPAVSPPEPARDLDGMLRRLHLPTVRRLHADLATRAETEGMGYRVYLETLIAEEIAHRSETRLTRALSKARFPFLRTIDDFNFTFQTALKLQMLGSYLGPELVTEGGAPSSVARVARANRISASRSRTGPFSTATRRASSRPTC